MLSPIVISLIAFICFHNCYASSFAYKSLSESTFPYCAVILGQNNPHEDRFMIHEFKMSDGSAARLHGVFDGHGGWESAQLLKEEFGPYLELELLKVPPHIIHGGGSKLISEISDRINDAVYEQDNHICVVRQFNDGTTASFVLRLEKYAFIVNIGDSRTVVFEDNEPIFFSRYHKPADPSHVSHPDYIMENKHIIKKGGHVVYSNDCLRVQSILAMTRAFGDCFLKRNHKKSSSIMSLFSDFGKAIPEEDYDPEGIVRVTPDITPIVLEEGKEYLFMSGTDGLFDAELTLKNQKDVPAFWKRNLHRRLKYGKHICETLANFAYNLASEDDITIVIDKYSY